jgi:hypothetical protein
MTLGSAWFIYDIGSAGKKLDRYFRQRSFCGRQFFNCLKDNVLETLRGKIQLFDPKALGEAARE